MLFPAEIICIAPRARLIRNAGCVYIMIKKIVFMAVFAPVHSALTALCVVHWLNWNYVVDTGLWPRFINLCAKILSLPLLLPLMMADAEGERFPIWFRQGSLLVNSLVWAVLILLLVAAVSRFRLKKQGIATPNKTKEPTDIPPAVHR